MVKIGIGVCLFILGMACSVMNQLEKPVTLYNVAVFTGMIFGLVLGTAIMVYIIK
jgi:hypothetical protein